MHYVVVLVLVAIIVFLATPSLKKTDDSTPLDIREVKYKFGMPKVTQPAGTRQKDDVTEVKQPEP